MPARFESDAISYALELVDQTEKAANAAFARLQRDVVLSSTKQGGLEKASLATALQVDELKLRELRTARLLTRELALQEQMARGIRDGAGKTVKDPLGKVLGGARGRVTDFASLADSFAPGVAMNQRLISLFAGQIGTLIAFGGAVSAVTGGVRFLIDAQADLQDSSAKLATVLDVEGKSFREGLKENIDLSRQWAKGHGQDVAAVIDAQFALAAAGLKNNQVIAATPAVALLAQGGLLELAEASETVSTQIQVFRREGLTAIDIVNRLQSIAADSQTDVRELGVALRYSSASAVAANQSFGDTIALLGVLAQAGLRGSIAGTSLNQMFLQLLKNKGKIKELGIEVEDADGKLRPFVEILADFRKVFGTSISAKEEEILIDLFNARGARAALPLIQDMKELPRLLKSVADSEHEVFRTADENANKLRESIAVLGNQLRVFASQDLAIAERLMSVIDAVTNRQGLRTLANLQTGSAGVSFEVTELEAAMKKGGDAAREWLFDLNHAAEGVEGAVGKMLERVREQVGKPVGWEDVIKDWLNPLAISTGGGPGAFVRMQQGRKSITDAMVVDVLNQLKANKLLLQSEEDLARGARILQEEFGMVFDPMTASEAATWVKATDDVKIGFLNLRREMLQAALDADVFWGAGADTLREMLNAIDNEIAKRRSASDKGADLASSRFEQERLSNQISIQRAELSALEAVHNLEFSLRKEAADQRLALQVSVIKDTLDKEKVALKERLDAEELTGEQEKKLRGQKEREANALILAARRQAVNEKQQIDLDELQANFNAAGRARDLQLQLNRKILGDEKFLALQREKVLADFADKRELLLTQFMQGGLTQKAFWDEILNADRERTLALLDNQEQQRRRQNELLDLGQESAVLEAQMLLLRARGAEKFRQEEGIAWQEFNATMSGLNRDLLADGDLEKFAAKADVATARVLKALAEIKGGEQKFRRDVVLGSLDEMAGGLSQISDLIVSQSSRMRGKLLADLSTVVSASTRAVELISQLQAASALGGTAGALGQAGAVIGIVGLVAGVAQSIFGQRDRDAQVVRDLKDEFRQQAGKSVSADFARAQVFHVRIEVTQEIGFLGTPTPAQVAEVADLLVDPLVDELEQLGAIDVGGR